MASLELGKGATGAEQAEIAVVRVSVDESAGEDKLSDMAPALSVAVDDTWAPTDGRSGKDGRLEDSNSLGSISAERVDVEVVLAGPWLGLSLAPSSVD